MKTIAAVIAGLLLSLMTFVGGLLTSSIYLDTGNPHHRLERQDATALWTSRPVAVDRDRQSLKRLPARPAERQLAALNGQAASQTTKDVVTPDAAPVTDDRQPVVDPVTTGAVDPLATENKANPQAEQNTAHVEWCARHYRSYQAADNSYRSFGGDRRACRSPYSAPVTANAKQDDTPSSRREPENNIVADDSAAQVQEASFQKTPGAGAGDDHVQSCLRRYHSYRLEDNSYQPFDGGARRQCR